MSSFWQHLFRLQGTKLAHSSAYHSQSDGQTEVLNLCFENYLRSFVADQPRLWLQFLPWAEWHYNTAWHSSINMTPFEAVYGRPPPSLCDYVQGTSPHATLDELLSSRTALLQQLKLHLAKAQLRIKNQADARRTDITFAENDWVFLKLQPYRQSAVAHRKSNKLSKRFYGPFRVLEKIGQVAYRLELPPLAQIHNVFHVSLLKRCLGDPPTQFSSLPSQFIGSQPLLLPEDILSTRSILQNGSPTRQILVQWQHQPASEATWEPLNEFTRDFPTFNLEDKVPFDDGGNDTSKSGEKDTNGNILRTSTRIKKKPSRFFE
ncbi:hypothetical protein OROGR_019034 [Orobanche gracilis]